MRHTSITQTSHKCHANVTHASHKRHANVTQASRKRHTNITPARSSTRHSRSIDSKAPRFSAVGSESSV
eukprot:3549138-Pyramimonas_sp.AAC.1